MGLACEAVEEEGEENMRFQFYFPLCDPLFEMGGGVLLGKIEGYNIVTKTCDEDGERGWEKRVKRHLEWSHKTIAEGKKGIEKVD
jgi:hypothetical protein